MAENRKGKENRYYFSRGQMVLLGGAFVLVSLIVFGLGIFIGKGIEERKIAKIEEPLVKIPVKPEGSGANNTAGQKKDEITFNDAPPKAAAVVEEKVKQKVAEKIAGADAPPTKVEKKSEKITAEAAPKKVEASAKAEGESADQAKVWRAQVNAYPDERSARQLVDRLKNKGYNAYVSEVQNKGKTWYRVSVGRFNNRDEAEKIIEALKTKENFPKTFLASK